MRQKESELAVSVLLMKGKSKMKESIENGFTVFVSKKEDKLIGVGLRRLEYNRGIQPTYMEQENLTIIDDFSFLHLLEDGKTMQMYKGVYGGKMYPCYVAQIGSIVGEGPYAEDECFAIEVEGAGSNFYDALISLEEQCRKIEETRHELPVKKAYRLYGDPRYETCKRW